MPDEIIPQNTSEVRNPSEKLQVVMQSLTEGSGTKLSENQVNEVLSQRREVNGYIHEERMQRHERYKIGSKDKRLYFFLALLFSVLVMCLKPEYFTEVLFALLGFAGGYGVGRGAERHEEEQS
jgi:hypothetical protein